MTEIKESSAVNTVGIITSEESFINNYGAALQGYALAATLKDLGYTPYVIRYSSYKPPKTEWIKNIVKALIRYNPEKKTREQIRTEKKVARKYKKSIEKRESFFRDFQMNHIPFYSEKRYYWQDIQKNPPIFDAYLCGSDQIWNPYFHHGLCDPGYFLAFAPAGKKCIAYAPSTGSNQFPKSFLEDFEKKTERFCAVSLREKSSAAALSNALGRTIDYALDPTLLASASAWERIRTVPEGIPERYILSYRFADNPVMKRAIHQISDKLHIPVISIPLSSVALQDDFEQLFSVGPAEFVGLIEKAELVITDSFHATVFSIMQHTPFITFPRESFNEKASMNTRVEDLLTSCGMMDRYVSDVKTACDAVNAKICYDQYEHWIAGERERSIKFIQEALK